MDSNAFQSFLFFDLNPSSAFQLGLSSEYDCTDGVVVVPASRQSARIPSEEKQSCFCPGFVADE